MADLTQLNIRETADGLANKAFTSVEVTKAYLDRIAAVDSNIHSYLTVSAESALAEAKQADERRSKGDDHALLGVPLAIKDNMTTVGIRTTAASKMLENYQPSYDATAIAKLKQAGAVILGKTNLDEWAHGASTENSAFGPTKNPWDTARVPGGSSGGSAAAVAADLCAGALGSDTGGSIRYPAAFCGIYGLKPSYGRVSRSGLLSMTSSTDVIGPMTKTAEDAAILLETIAGPDPLDKTAYPKEVKVGEYVDAVRERKNLSEMTFGVVKEWMETDGLTAGIRTSIEEGIARIKELGGKVVEVSLPHAKYGIPVYYVITPSEISSNLARYDGIRYGHRTTKANNLFEVYAKSRGEGFGPEAKRRIMIGTYALSYGYYDAFYLKAQKVRTLISRELEGVLRQVDAIIGPSSPHVAFKLGQNIDDPLKMYLEDVFMGTASLAGLPSLSFPIGFAEPEDGGSAMPVGMQIIGRRFDEGTILAVASAVESAHPMRSKKPTL